METKSFEQQIETELAYKLALICQQSAMVKFKKKRSQAGEAKQAANEAARRFMAARMGGDPDAAALESLALAAVRAELLAKKAETEALGVVAESNRRSDALGKSLGHPPVRSL